MPPPRQCLRPQVTLRQMMICVVTCAALFAYYLPLMRLRESPLALWIAWSWGGPWVMAATVLIFARRGPLKDWLVWFLLALPVYLFLLVIMLMALAVTLINLMPGAHSGFEVVLPLLFTWALGLPFMSLFHRRLPRKCPQCGRRRLLRDRSTETLPGFRSTEVYWCASCGAKLKRWYPDSWERIDLG